MGTKAFLQKGRTRPGIVLPANAVAKVNQANDRSALIREAEYKKSLTEHADDPLPNIGDHVAAKHCPEPEPVVEVPEPEPVASVEVEVETVDEVVESNEPELPPETTVESEALVEEVETEPGPEALPVTEISGIGAALAERFATYGYKTLGDLACADPDTINQIPGARQRGRQWIEEALARVGPMG